MPPANRAGDQFDTLVVVRHQPVLEDSLKPSRLCRVSGRNGGQFIRVLAIATAPATAARKAGGLASGRTQAKEAILVHYLRWRPLREHKTDRATHGSGAVVLVLVNVN